ncbi:hypothetical protein [Nocardia sp. NPDC049526]|uniref:hypothetical protein n=1 Tax=Nocardia sp. NPDC049526 TaxID=3364316 RepID=UPI0037A041D1
MSDLDDRVGLAVEWLCRNQLADGLGGAGWGWVSDVPPNPQNTAEVVCALTAAGREVPRADEVSVLVRRSVVARESGEWAFQSPIDVSWRLRALQALGVSPTDPDVVDSMRALLAEQDADSGGWRFSRGAGPISVTATANSIRALAGLGSEHEEAAQALLRGTTFLVTSMLDNDPRVRPVYACAYVAFVVARPEIAALGGKRIDRVRELAVGQLLEGLRRREEPVEEEAFRRNEVADTWRHLSLHLAVGAVVVADSQAIFDPGVRQGLVDLLDLQETAALHANRGGFRTSAEGFVTSYATVQGLEAMTYARAAVNERVSPARVFDMICRVDGVHHADAQQVIEVDGRAVMMNSHGGALVLAATGSAGLTIAVLAVIFADELGVVGSRTLVVWGTLFIALGSFTGVATRLPSVPKVRIAAAVFAAFTAVVLPVVTFLLSS